MCPVIRRTVSAFSCRLKIRKSIPVVRRRCSLSRKHWANRFPHGDHATLIRGIREQLFALKDDTIVYPRAWTGNDNWKGKGDEPVCRSPGLIRKREVESLLSRVD